jgi:hypothetical protein
VGQLSCPESQQVSAVDEPRYAALMAPVRARWLARAAEPGRGEVKTVYALRRAAALARPYRAKLSRCGQRGTVIKCGCKGWRGVALWGCRQHLMCAGCAAKRSKRMTMRVRAGLEASMSAAPQHARLVLVTLTIRHSGDIATDRRELALGWRKLYRAMERRWGTSPYVGAWEVTPGDDGQGHVHAHLVVLWCWRDWGEVRSLWLQCCPRSERITFVARRRDNRPSSPRSCAKYLAKYLGKGVNTAEFTPELRADVLAAWYQTRAVFSSVRFWVPWVPCCPGCKQPRVGAQYLWHGVPYQPRDRREPHVQLRLQLGERAGPLHREG